MDRTKPAFVFALFALSLSGIADSQRRGDVATYADATFNFSPDPTKVVLHITQSSQDMYVRSLTLYGDGRAEIQVKAGTAKVVAEYTRDLPFESVQKILRNAVDHGLAEWDSARIHSLQLRDLDGRPYGGPVDGPLVTILLSLDGYQRGSYSVGAIERAIRVRAPDYAARVFPDIPEFKGIENLVVLLYEQLKLAEAVTKQ